VHGYTKSILSAVQKDQRSANIQGRVRKTDEHREESARVPTNEVKPNAELQHHFAITECGHRAEGHQQECEAIITSSTK